MNMLNRNLNRIAELRWKAAQWRRHAAETGSHSYAALMERAARDLEYEAERLEQGEQQQPELFAAG